MRVLITTDLFTTETNGVVTSVRNLREQLTARGHEVRILTTSNNRHSRKEDGTYYVKSLSMEWVYPDVRVPVSGARAYVKELIEWKPDIIHTQCEICSYQFALKISKKTKAPIVHTYHTMYEDYVGYVIPFKRLGRWLVKKLVKIRLKRARVIIVPTEKVKRSLESYGISDRIKVMPSGINLEQHKMRITEEERKITREKYGIGASDRVLINLGRLGAEKNLLELIEYTSTAMHRYPDLKLLIVGDGPAKKSLEKLSSSLDTAGRVKFTGMVKPSLVHHYYQLGDVFVSASTSETQGLTYVEAMANGLPLLCRADDCLTGVLHNGDNGYAYNTEEEFHNYLNLVLSDREWRMQAGARSAELSSPYDKSKFGENAENIYAYVLNSDNK